MRAIFIPILLFVFNLNNLTAGKAIGVYAHADFGTTPDSKAKLVEYTRVRKSGTRYIFQGFAAGEKKIAKVNFRGAVSYPKWNAADSLKTIEGHYTKLSNFRKKFPQSSHLLDRKILLLKQQINVKKNSIVENKGKNYLGNFTTKDGKVFKQVKLVKKYIDSIEIDHLYGVGRINHSVLPKSVIDKVGGFDKEAIRVSKLSLYELAKEEHVKLLKKESEEISTLKSKMRSVSKPKEPEEFRNLKQVTGSVLNKLPNGYLVLRGNRVFAVVDKSKGIQENERYSNRLVKTSKTYTYPTVKGSKHIAVVYKQPGYKIQSYDSALSRYNKTISEYKSKIQAIEKLSRDRLNRIGRTKR